MGTRSQLPAVAWDYPPGFVLKIIIIINLTSLGAVLARGTGWENLTRGYRADPNYFFPLSDIARFEHAMRF